MRLLWQMINRMLQLGFYIILHEMANIAFFL